ncbi:MAG: hypothetical protein WA364_17150 [Candidatus Nitrosopolaris sp.]
MNKFCQPKADGNVSKSMFVGMDVLSKADGNVSKNMFVGMDVLSTGSGS